MDHELAVNSQACEKYLLGELSPELRDAYEEHYFSCAECAAQLQSVAELVGASPAILAEGPLNTARPQPIGAPSGWFGWLKPGFLVPAFALLLLVIGYQNFVTIPNMRRAGGPQVLRMFSLISANTRGDGGLVFSLAPNEPFGVYVDVPADSAYLNYLLRLEDPTGASRLLRSLTAQEAQKTQVVAIDPGGKSGKYAIVVSGLTSPGADASTAKELARLQFTVELTK